MPTRTGWLKNSWVHSVVHVGEAAGGGSRSGCGCRGCCQVMGAARRLPAVGVKGERGGGAVLRSIYFAPPTAVAVRESGVSHEGVGVGVKLTRRLESKWRGSSGSCEC